MSEKQLVTFREWWEQKFPALIEHNNLRNVCASAWSYGYGTGVQSTKDAPPPPTHPTALRVGALVKYTGAEVSAVLDNDARNERSLVYLGEIPNMPGHGIFAGSSGRIHFGYHINEFREATEEEV